MHDPSVRRADVSGPEVGWGGRYPAGAARLELVSGVVQPRPEDAMSRRSYPAGAPSRPRGACARTPPRHGAAGAAVRGVHQRASVAAAPAHMAEWSLHLTAEEHLAPATIRAYQCTLRQFTEDRRTRPSAAAITAAGRRHSGSSDNQLRRKPAPALDPAASLRRLVEVPPPEAAAARGPAAGSPIPRPALTSCAPETSGDRPGWWPHRRARRWLTRCRTPGRLPRRGERAGLAHSRRHGGIGRSAATGRPA